MFNPGEGYEVKTFRDPVKAVVALVVSRFRKGQGKVYRYNPENGSIDEFFIGSFYSADYRGIADKVFEKLLLGKVS